MVVEIHVTQGAPAEATARLEALLDAQAAAQGHRFGGQKTVFEARDPAGGFLGGLQARFGLNWIFVELLAVQPEARGAGIGSRLLAALEAQARDAGMDGIWLDTYAFQAPGFYRRQGFVEFGRIAEYPPGSSRRFLCKRLDAGAAAAPGADAGAPADSVPGTDKTRAPGLSGGRAMRTIGLLGGMSAASTAIYYQRLNTLTQEALGGLHSAEIVMRSVDFARIAALQDAGDWAAAGAALHREARALEQAGADLLILATNTMHKVAPQITQGLTVPLLHIAEVTAQAIRRAGLSRPGLMATAYTMEQAFYLDALRAAGLEPVVPDAQDRAAVHRIIYDELCRGVVRAPSRATFETVAARLKARGADSLIAGCTEVGMLLGPSNVAVPFFDSLDLHCRAAVAAALAR